MAAPPTDACAAVSVAVVASLVTSSAQLQQAAVKVALPTPTSRPPDAAAVLARLRLAVADALDVFPVPAVHGGGVGAAAAGGAGDPPSEAAAGSRRPSVALDGEETPAGCSPLSSRASVHCMPVCGGLGCRLVCAVCRAVGVAVGGGCGCGWWVWLWVVDQLHTHRRDDALVAVSPVIVVLWGLQ